MKLMSACLMILLWALASGPALARGGQGQSFGGPGSPMLQGGQFHSSARSGFVGAHKGQCHPPFHSRAVVIGAPYFAPFYYPGPYYYYPPVAYAPQDYIEEEGAAPDQAYWYYCAGAKAYYPYVKECPGGWQRVAPPPPPASNY